MRFAIRFKIGNRFGEASIYSLRELVLSIVDLYSLTETELCTIVTLDVEEACDLRELSIKRVGDCEHKIPDIMSVRHCADFEKNF